MSSHHVVLIPGDGIGPEVAAAAQAVIDASGADITWHTYQAGITALEAGEASLPEKLLKAVRQYGIVLKGPLTTPVGGGFSSVNVALRRQLGLYANLRPVRTIPGVPSRYQDVDLVIIRENTEGLYSGDERWEDDGTVVGLKKVTREASLRIARFAFEFAYRNNRGMVTVVHKANILKESDGLFLACAQEVAEFYPQVRFKDRIVDALCMDLVIDPSRHDVLLCPNLYGDIISDLAAGLVGGLGTIPGANIGQHQAVFEAVHGSAPDIAGKGIANPTALIMAGSMMLLHLGEEEAAGKLAESVHSLYRNGGPLTPDIGGQGTTGDVMRALVSCLEQQRG